MYCLIESRSDLAMFLDEIIACLREMIAVTGSHGQSVESLVNLMISFADSPLGYNLLYLDDETNEMKGILFAIANKFPERSWVEVVALWGPDLVLNEKRELTEQAYEVQDMLATWAKGVGAGEIISVIIRSPELFFKHFHSKLGYEKSGILVRKGL